MMDILIFVGGVLAKAMAVGVIAASCTAIYLIESHRSADGALQ